MKTISSTISRRSLLKSGAAAGATALFAKFSRGDEAEADEEGFKNVVRAGISPEGLVTMFQTLIDERQKSPGTVDAWFATHG